MLEEETENIRCNELKNKSKWLKAAKTRSRGRNKKHNAANSANSTSDRHQHTAFSTTATTPHHRRHDPQQQHLTKESPMLKDSALTLRSFGSCVRCTGNTRHPCGKLKKSTSRKMTKARTVCQVFSDEHVKHIMALFAASEGRMNEDLAVQFASEVQSSVLRFFHMATRGFHDFHDDSLLMVFC